MAFSCSVISLVFPSLPNLGRHIRGSTTGANDRTNKDQNQTTTTTRCRLKDPVGHHRFLDVLDRSRNHFLVSGYRHLLSQNQWVRILLQSHVPIITHTPLTKKTREFSRKVPVALGKNIGQNNADVVDALSNCDYELFRIYLP